ncbi:MAG: recombinase family protein, partial [Gemmatimonadaceae bacterium]|nr:recombinase family protein [Gemmatimonadaceae bacterium]
MEEQLMGRPISMTWQERLARSGSEVPATIRYTRKSTLAEDRQAASHEQQAQECDRRLGHVPDEWTWRDSMSGTRLDRPALQAMLEFCRAHPRSTQSPGKIQMWDISRLMRGVDGRGAADPLPALNLINELKALGWTVQFVDKPVVEGPYGVLMSVFDAFQAGQYSAELSKNVKRGKQSVAAQGFWVGGSAPWGTKRVVHKTGVVLNHGELSLPNDRIVLAPDENVLRIWKRCAEMICSRRSLSSVAAQLYAEGVVGRNGRPLSHSSLRNFLTNPVLVGRVEFRDSSAPGGRRRVKAMWPPMVDEGLMDAVVERLGHKSRYGRSGSSRNTRKRGELYPLTPRCGRCGARFIGTRYGAKQGRARAYAHEWPKRHENELIHDRIRAAGCRNWYV